ncbi:MAG: site-specific DNA-methyltransferase [Chitinophagia bacterium]|nr:site-specific DNA-methyltransferase [Chitinophagia bacterium]
MTNQLYYGDNLEVLRKYIPDESIDLCYIDPPFNSKRNYNQIYNNIGTEDKAQAQAFTDTWTWDDIAIAGYNEIVSGGNPLFTIQCVELMKGLKMVLGTGSILAYLVSMAQRIAEIYRVLKPTGSFYLHCDPTASHYLKILIDSIFCSNRYGELRNELVWCYSRMAAKGQKQLSRCHDIIFWYSKGKTWQFNVDAIRLPYAEGSKARAGYKKTNLGGGKPASEICELNEIGKFPEDWVQIPFIRGNEYLGYPTQKPLKLLERIIKASSNEGDTILDAYCGCGTSIAVAQRLNRRWIGIDITYQSISVILKRLSDTFGSEVANSVALSGIPKDLEAAKALALKKDDRLRKEFEKWAVLTYSNNKARINDKKGADGGIDGIAQILIGIENRVHIEDRVLFSVKSGKITLAMVRDFCHVVNRENAAIGIFITLEEPTKPMLKEAKEQGTYTNPLNGQQYPKVEIVTINEILQGKRLQLPQAMEVLKTATKQKDKGKELGF